jgi:hypothetical protein
MTRILLVGPEPETIDYTDPALPPGLDVVKVPPDGTAAAMLQAQLAGTEYQCVVIGTGLRLPPKNLLLFELAINIIHKTAPNAAIAFNTGPVQTSDAAARWVLERK